MRSAIWYHLNNLKNVKNTHEGVLLLQAKASSFTKNNTPSWVFHIFKIVQMVPNRAKHHIWNLKSCTVKQSLNELKFMEEIGCLPQVMGEC